MFDPDGYNDHQVIADFLGLLPHFIKSKTYKTNSIKLQQRLQTNIRLRIARLNIRKNGLIFYTTTIDRNRIRFVLFCLKLCKLQRQSKTNYFWSNWCLFSRGEMYSGLLNYYANRVLLHSKENELIKAEYFGFLSIRQDNDDTLICE
jgi:hypothetical protein